MTAASWVSSSFQRSEVTLNLISLRRYQLWTRPQDFWSQSHCALSQTNLPWGSIARARFRSNSLSFLQNHLQITSKETRMIVYKLSRGLNFRSVKSKDNVKKKIADARWLTMTRTKDIKLRRVDWRRIQMAIPCTSMDFRMSKTQT